MDRPEVMDGAADAARRTNRIAVLLALFLSGAAAMVNQVVWQRALRIHLGGAEALSSMGVVFVFILGISIGNGLAGHLTLTRPLVILAAAEGGLALANSGVAMALTQGGTGRFFAEYQRFCLNNGVPLRLGQWVLLIAVLLVPTVLMGMTQPVAVAGLARKSEDDGADSLMVVGVNTIGALLGAWIAGFVLLPLIGQTRLLLGASAINAFTALLLTAAPRVKPAPKHAGSEAPVPYVTPDWLSIHNTTGALLGFASLAYEMVLFRLLALSREPLPTTFTLGLCGFLGSWTLGLFYSLRNRRSNWAVILFVAAALAALPYVHLLDRTLVPGGSSWLLPIYFLPSFGFGVNFGSLVNHKDEHLEKRLGRFASLNTLGSCLGVLASTLVLLEMPVNHALYLLAFFVASAGLWWASGSGELRLPAFAKFAAGACLVACLGVAGVLSRSPFWQHPVYGTVFSSRDGVVEVQPAGQVMWDGLWHAQLASPKSSPLGTSHWWLSAAPLLAHDGIPKNAAVIGLGSGVTAATMALMPSIEKVTVYEINEKLEEVHRRFADGTLHDLENPKIHIVWRDGRLGLTLSDEKFDVLTQQPLYLKQAGASQLLSIEHFRLVKSRLNPGGVYCIYSNAHGFEARAELVRETARQVFPYQASLLGGTLLLVSDSPLKLDEETLTRRIAAAGPLGWQADRLVEYQKRFAPNLRSLADFFDHGGFSWRFATAITDDRPVLEYADAVLLFKQMTPQ